MRVKPLYAGKIVLSAMLEARATITDEGILVCVTGGDHTHIGSVSIVDPKGRLESRSFEGHMDHVVGDNWARSLYTAFSVPVLVSAGIHYDGISKGDIQLVVKESDELMNDMILKIHKELQTK